MQWPSTIDAINGGKVLGANILAGKLLIKEKRAENSLAAWTLVGYGSFMLVGDPAPAQDIAFPFASAPTMSEETFAKCCETIGRHGADKDHPGLQAIDWAAFLRKAYEILAQIFGWSPLPFAPQPA